MTRPDAARPATPAELEIRRGTAAGVPVSNLSQAMELSRVLAMSTLCPDALRGKPADVLAVLLYGAELGLSAWQSMQGINVIKGRATMSAELRVAKTRERGHRISVVCVKCGQWQDHKIHEPQQDDRLHWHRFEADWTNERCTVKARRYDTGEEATVTWTVEDAIQAGLLRREKESGKMVARSSKGEPLPWEQYTRDMLYHRAGARAARTVAPEVGYGVYTPDETSTIVEAQREDQAEAQPVCSYCRGRGHSSENCPQIIDASVDPEEQAADVANIEAEFNPPAQQP